MSTIYLIRHGQIPSSSPRRFIGRTDFELTQRGREQISSLAAQLESIEIARIISSPLLRCRQSSEILAESLGCGIEIVPGLAEIDLGDWDGLSVTEVQEKFPGEYKARGLDIAGFRPSGGESFEDLLVRVFPAFSFGVASGENTAVVAHAGVNRVLLCHMLGMPLENLFLLDQDYGCLNVIQKTNGFFRVSSINSGVNVICMAQPHFK